MEKVMWFHEEKKSKMTAKEGLLRNYCDDNMIKMARKPGKKQKENPVGCTGEGKRKKGNKRRVRRRYFP